MAFVLLFLFLVSFVLLVFTFIYPFGLVSLIVQLFIVGVALTIVYFRYKKQKGYVFLALLTFFHFLVLIAMAFIFLTIALPQREESDFKDIGSGIQKLWKSKNGSLPAEKLIPDAERGVLPPLDQEGGSKLQDDGKDGMPGDVRDSVKDPF